MQNTFDSSSKDIQRLALEELPLSIKTINALKRVGCRSFGDLLHMTDQELRNSKSISETSAIEILSAKENFPKKAEFQGKTADVKSVLEIVSLGINELSDLKKYGQLVVMCRVQKSKISLGHISPPPIQNLQDFFELDIFIDYEYRVITKAIKNSGFSGIAVKELAERLPEFATNNTLGLLMKRLNDDVRYSERNSRVYYCYPSFFSALEHLPARENDILSRRLDGHTLRNIAEGIGGLSGEIVRQIESAAMEKLIRENSLFAEDRYANLFRQYAHSDVFLLNTLPDGENTVKYLRYRYHPGQRPLSYAAADLSLPDEIRTAVEHWLVKSGVHDMPAVNVHAKNATEKAINTSALNKDVPIIALKRLVDEATVKKYYPRLLRKINQTFDKKLFIGDIAITDEEYPILCDYLKIKYRAIAQSKSPLTDCPAFAVALVQIAVRKYSGNHFWPLVGAEIGEDLSNAQSQFLIGTSFIHTLKAHGKYVQSETERVSSILFHTFVSNYYSLGLFELLFQYYANDLERDLSRNSAEQMQALMDTLAKKSQLDEKESNLIPDRLMQTGSKAYMLRQHTLQAISVNQIHSSVRLRRFIRLLDKAFWNGTLPKNPTSRLTIMFKKWALESEPFHQECKKHKMGEISGRGKKHFSSPYLFSDIQRGVFSLKLPSQIVREEFSDGLSWLITTDSRTIEVSVPVCPILTGSKTERLEQALDTREIFGELSCTLLCGSNVVRKFGTLERSDYRFFDMEGDHVSKLIPSLMCAYTKPEVFIRSAALQDHFETNGTQRWDFDFDDGDIVFLPDGKSMTVGNRYVNSFAPRGRVNDAYYLNGTERISVYSSIPNLILSIPQDKFPGTAISVNGTRYKLKECKYVDFENGDAGGTRAFYLSIGQFAQIRNLALNTVILDIPGYDLRSFPFVYADGLTVEFDGAPYIFEERGTIAFADGFSGSCENVGVRPLPGVNGFSFQLEPDLTELKVLFGQALTLHFPIPVLMWSFDGEAWHTEQIGDIWHSDFFTAKKLYLRSPAPTVEIAMEEDEDNGDDFDDYNSVKAEKSSAGLFVADMTRFKTWISRDRILNNVNIILDGKSYPFASVYSRSFASGCELEADYESGRLICHCDIIGKAKYFADIVHIDSSRMLAEKAEIHDFELTVNADIQNGKYLVELFEAEEDDSGFDEAEYYLFYRFETSLINKNDFSGQNLQVRRFRLNSGTLQHYENIRGSVYVAELKKTDKLEYDGILSVGGICTDIRVHTIFSDNENERSFQLYFYDEYNDLNDFEFDSKRRMLIRDENDAEPDLDASERYRRYKMLFNDDYCFFGSLTDSIKESDEEIDKDDGKEHIGLFNAEKAAESPLALTIDELGLTRSTYDLLQHAGLGNVFAITFLKEDQLIRKGLHNRNIEELRSIFSRFGKKIEK